MSSGSESDSDKSDIVIQSRLVPQNGVKKPPRSPQEHLQKDPKKLTTKEMIHSALEELKTRKGVSLYAIKKYMVDKYNVDTDKTNFYIKKYIKLGVEDGTIVQTKGIGASGSFKLAPGKKPETKRKKKKKIEKPDKPKKEIQKKVDPEKKKTEKKNDKKEVKMTKEKSTKEKEIKKPKVKMTKESKKEKLTVESKKGSLTSKTKKKMGVEKTIKKKVGVEKTPSKKKVMMMSRKSSIGSIIKPPKMKPKKT